MADRELQSHKKSDKIKWIITAIAFVLIFAILVGMCVHLSLLGKGSDYNAPKAVTETRTLTFDDLDKRTSISEVEQVWEENGIVFTNFKGDGISINEEYYNPIRLYKRSMVVVECEEMTDIVFYCSNSTYMDNLKSSFENVSGITVKEIESNVMVVFDKPADSFAIYDLAGIVYLKQVAVTVIVSFSEEQIEDEASGGLIVTSKDSNNVSFSKIEIPVELYNDYGISPLVENALMLTATITPDNVSSSKVEWSVSWADSSSSWASGKDVTDYVTVSPTSNGSLTATVTCIQAFGEKVNVTVSTTDGTDLSATCVCDYVKRVSKVDLVVPQSLISDDRGFDTSVNGGPYYVKLYPAIGSTAPQNMQTSVTYGVGTIQEDITVEVSYYLTEYYYSVLSTNGYTINSNHFNSGKTSVFQNNEDGCRAMFGNNFFTDVSYANAVIFVLTSSGNKALTFKVTAVGEHNNYSVEYSPLVDTSAMTVKAKGITSDYDGYNF